MSMSMMPCQADGNPLPIVQWYRHRRRVNASMLLTRMDSGQFILEAWNNMGRSNTTIDITVECECMRSLTLYTVYLYNILDKLIVCCSC